MFQDGPDESIYSESIRHSHDYNTMHHRMIKHFFRSSSPPRYHIPQPMTTKESCLYKYLHHRNGVTPGFFMSRSKHYLIPWLLPTPAMHSEAPSRIVHSSLPRNNTPKSLTLTEAPPSKDSSLDATCNGHCAHRLPFQRFHVLFNSLFKVLFIFPSRYLFAIGLVSIFSFR